MPHQPSTTVFLQSALQAAERDQQPNYAPLIDMAQDRLLRLTRRMFHRFPHLRRWEQTDDVFQNAMVRFHRSLEAVQPDSPKRFFGLAVTQIRRTLIDLARHHFGPEGPAAHHETGFEAGEADGRQNQDSTRATITDEGPETVEAWSAFHQAVEQLPEAEQDVFQLVWYGGLEQAAASELLDVSLSTVQRRWYRARHLLASKLAAYHSDVRRAESHE